MVVLQLNSSLSFINLGFQCGFQTDRKSDEPELQRQGRRASSWGCAGFGETSIDLREQLSTCFSFAVRGRPSIMRLGAPPDSATPRGRARASGAFPERTTTTEGFEGLRTSLSYGTLTPRQKNLDSPPLKTPNDPPTTHFHPGPTEAGCNPLRDSSAHSAMCSHRFAQ